MITLKKNPMLAVSRKASCHGTVRRYWGSVSFSGTRGRELGIKPQALSLIDDALYLLNHSHLQTSNLTHFFLNWMLHNCSHPKCIPRWKTRGPTLLSSGRDYIFQFVLAPLTVSTLSFRLHYHSGSQYYNSKGSHHAPGCCFCKLLLPSQ